jgi:hypothetical protein
MAGREERLDAAPAPQVEGGGHRSAHAETVEEQSRGVGAEDVVGSQVGAPRGVETVVGEDEVAVHTEPQGGAQPERAALEETRGDQAMEAGRCEGRGGGVLVDPLTQGKELEGRVERLVGGESSQVGREILAEIGRAQSRSERLLHGVAQVSDARKGFAQAR